MATQGLVSVVKSDVVVMKFITGEDGYNAKVLADALLSNSSVSASLEDAYNLARSCGFGSSASLVVMNESDIEFRGDDDIHPRYRATFRDPGFNPRWESGFCEYVEIVTF